MSIRCVQAIIVGLCVGFSLPLALADPPAGAGSPPAGLLHLRVGDVATSSANNALQTKSVTRFATGEHYVIQLDGPMTPERRAALARAGIKLGDYLPTNAFIAKLPAISPATIMQLRGVTWLGRYQPAWRIDPQIGTRVYQSAERKAIAARGELAVTVYLFEDEEFDPALAAMGEISGAQIAAIDLLGDQPLINVVLPAASLPLLANVPAVQFVEEYPEFTYRNTSDRWIVQSNIVNVTPLYNHGLHGEGQVLGHIDGNIGVGHCSFYDTNPIGPTHRKILAQNDLGAYNAHGTHTAGTAVGDAGTFAETRGVAYLAKLVHNSTPVMTESQMFSRFDLHRTQGATVHTNSWGNDATTTYDGACRAIDNFSWQYDDNLICFAVTNQSVLKNPENAKNVLAVGACQDTPNQASFCSGGTGPTADGRRKPEIFAPGCSIYSSSGSTACNVAPMTGTSMACPAIAGTALLVRQYFTEGFYPSGAANPADAFVPSGALLKAVLINSAVDMTGISGYPSNQEGWGRVLADNALYFPGDTRKLLVHDARNNGLGSLGTGEAVEYNFSVDSSFEQLRITLAWHDYPATAGASNPVVNGLDLIVTDPYGTIYLGNVFSGGVSVAGGSEDNKNNVEQVHLNTPPTGTWNVMVSGASVNTGSQGYALVITGDASAIVCPSIDAPPASQTVTEGGTVILTVEANGTAPLTYHWRKQGVRLGEGGNISGTTTASLTISPVTVGDAGDYDVEVSNACSPVISPLATLDVWAKGDVNCDGSVDFSDVNPFVLELSNPAAYAAEYPQCPTANADIDGDGSVNFGDINPFVTLLSARSAARNNAQAR
jgi:hypothetical protein